MIEREHLRSCSSVRRTYSKQITHRVPFLLCGVICACARRSKSLPLVDIATCANCATSAVGYPGWMSNEPCRKPAPGSNARVVTTINRYHMTTIITAAGITLVKRTLGRRHPGSSLRPSNHCRMLRLMAEFYGMRYHEHPPPLRHLGKLGVS